MGSRLRIAVRFACASLAGIGAIGVASVRAADEVARGGHGTTPDPVVPGDGAQPAPPPCPDGMALVEGDFCPRLEQTCLRWMDPPGRFHEYRCAEYAAPARCRAPRVHRRFCIDRRERSEPDTGLPLNRQSWTDAKNACAAAGARVCKDSEWTFACEGEEMRPYPYGWSRAASRCNADRVDLLVPALPGHSANARRLRDERDPVGAHPECISPFGILDMAGNVAEWVSVDGFAEGSVVVQKGNWWQPGKQACRDEQAGHDRFYEGAETGFRCCASAANEGPGALVAGEPAQR